MKTKQTFLALLFAFVCTFGMSFGCDNGGDGDADADADADHQDADEEQDADPDGGDADEADAEEAGPDHCMESSTECTGTCKTPPYEIPCVGGVIQNENGDPLPGQTAVVCVEYTAAPSACRYGTADEMGFFSVRIPDVSTVERVALYFTTDPPHHTPYCELYNLCDGNVRVCEPWTLYPAPTEGTDIPEGELTEDIRIEAEDGAALIFRAGTKVDLPITAMIAGLGGSLSRFPLDEGRQLPCFIDSDNPPLALYVFTPIDSMVLDPDILEPTPVPASLDLPNDTNLPAGTEVDIFVVGGGHPTVYGTHEGEWSSAVTATVTKNGERIQTADGEGISQLTWFAVYPR